MVHSPAKRRAKTVMERDTIALAKTKLETLPKKKFPLPALPHTLEQLQLIVQNIQDGITIQQADGSLMYANEMAAKLIGFASAEELLATSVSNIMDRFEILDIDGSPFDLKNMPSRMAFLDGKEHESILYFRSKDSFEKRCSVVRSIPVKDHTERVTSVINIFHDISEQKRQQDMEHFLLEASTLLASSLDLETTLKHVAQLAVPTMADWCTIGMLTDDGRFESVVVAHRDPEKVQWAERVGKLYPTDLNAPQGIGQVLRSGKAELYPMITDEMLKGAAKDERHLKIMRMLGMKSAMLVPLMVRERALGTISFISAESGHHFNTFDLTIAEDLGKRAGLAIDNARQYVSAQEEIAARKKMEVEMRRWNEKLERHVAERTQTLAQEVTERKRAQEEEHAHLQRLKDIINHMPFGAIAIDDQDNILHANNRMVELFSLPLELHDLMRKKGCEVFEIIKAQTLHPKEYFHRWQEMIERKEPTLAQELPLVNGRILSRDYIPLFVNMRYRGHLLLYRDITREKRVDATKSEFMSLASHQLRTPLTAIRWSLGRVASAMQRGQMGEAEKKLIHEGKTAAIRMAETIDTMLIIARIEAGKVQPELSPLSLLNIFRELQIQSEREYERKEQLLTISCDPALIVMSDEHLLKEAIQNLVINAIKYTDYGGRIEIRAFVQENECTIEVEDTGYGIPIHQQQKLFTKFFRGDNVVSRDTNGTGLGLYLVSLMVHLLKGRVSYQSEEGKGSVFRIHLPISASHNDAGA